MMPIPTLPTDNLYKFLSVAGLIVIVASVAMWFVVAQQTVSDTNAVETEIQKLSEDFLRLTLEMHDLEIQAAT